MIELVFAPLLDGIAVTAADPAEIVTLDFALAFKGDAGITGLRYLTVADAQGTPIATLLTGVIQEDQP